MAVVTVEDKKNLIKLAIGMFGIAPGHSYLELMVNEMEHGQTLLQLATTLAGTDKFQALYPNSMGTEQFQKVFAARFLDPLGLAPANYRSTGPSTSSQPASSLRRSSWTPCRPSRRPPIRRTSVPGTC